MVARPGRIAALLTLALRIVTPHAAAAEQTVTYEHRVIVATTALDREQDVEASLERNVNRFGAAGFALAAIVGGRAAVIDRLLERKAYVAGQIDHAGQVLVIMVRPVGRPSASHEYRLLHTRAAFGTDAIVARLGAERFRLVATASDGNVFHAAFERQEHGEAIEYRVFANKGRTSWMAQIQNDSAVAARLSRVVPMGLDFALAELGSSTAPAGALEWMTSKSQSFTAQESKLKEKVRDGFHVETIRVRGTDIDMLLVKAAGKTGPAVVYDLDDGPWGTPCGSGTIVAADTFADGDTYCAADKTGEPPTNRGIDLTLRPESPLRPRLLAGPIDCATRALLGSFRGAAAGRVAVAAQIERELNRQAESGYHVTRALATMDESGTTRLTVFTSDAPMSVPSRAARAASGSVPALRAEHDDVGDTLTAQREDELNAALKREPALRDLPVWLEANDARASRAVRLAGCVPTGQSRDEVERLVRRLLARPPFQDFKLRNDLIVDR